MELNDYEWSLIEDALDFASDAKDNVEMLHLYWRVQRERARREVVEWSKEAFERYGN